MRYKPEITIFNLTPPEKLPNASRATTGENQKNQKLVAQYQNASELESTFWYLDNKAEI